MSHRLSVWCVAVFAVFSSMPFSSSDAQERVHTGRPVWRSFDTRDTGAASVTHQAQLNERGFVYAANDAGLLTFDGARWKLFKTGLSVRPINALLPLNGNRWLAGGSGIIGIFTPDQSGTLQWSNISIGSDDSEDEFSDTVLNILPTSMGTLILTDHGAIRFTDDNLSNIEIGVPTGLAFRNGDHIIVGI